MYKSIPFGKPNINELEIDAIKKVMESGILVHGDYTKKFEAAFAERIGTKNAIAVSSCTAGMHLSLFVNDIKTGDKVAVPAMTHVSTAHVVELQGATPIFIDVDPNTGNMSPSLLKKAFNENKIKAIMPVHYLGLPCEMQEINNLAKINNAIVIEDCALSLDGKYNGKQTGSLGECGCFSFYPVKHMTSIEGGMVTTDNIDLSRKIKKARAFGYNKELGERNRPGIYDVDKLGFNYRMNEVEAAVGFYQIKKLDDSLKKRKQNYKIIESYISKFDDLFYFPDKFGPSESSYYCLNIILNKKIENFRNLLQEYLKENKIGTSIHYPSAVPLFTYYKKKYGYKVGDFPVAENIGFNTLSLPLAPHVCEEDADLIGRHITKFVRNLKF